MKTYTNTSFKDHYPVGSAAVVHAHDPYEAAEALNKVLRELHHLPGDAKAEDMVEFTDNTEVRVLLDGEY